MHIFRNPFINNRFNWQAVLISQAVLCLCLAPVVWSASDSSAEVSQNNPTPPAGGDSAVAEKSEEEVRAKRLKELYLTRQRIQEIYSEKKQALRDKLEERLDEIDQEGGDFKARQAVKRGWRTANEQLKKAYKVAFLQCQKEIEKLEVKTGYESKRFNPIDVYKGKPPDKNHGGIVPARVFYPTPTH